MLNKRAVAVKSNSHYTCSICGSTENIQAHHEVPKDDSTLISLCGSCHADRHPDIPRSLFLCLKSHQPYWENKAAGTIAKATGAHPRTIIRNAKKANINKGQLSPIDEARLISLIHPHRKAIARPNYQPITTYIANTRVGAVTMINLHCSQCGHAWQPRQSQINICPKCKSLYWDKPHSTAVILNSPEMK